MASITITIPDNLVAAYQTRKAAHDAIYRSTPMALMNQAAAQRFIRDYYHGQYRMAGWRLDPGDGSVVDADDVFLGGV